eukprot:scaffold104313_cov45-Phaeocystis_antarctica.AAC.2
MPHTEPGVGRTHDARDRWAVARGYPAPLCLTLDEWGTSRAARACFVILVKTINVLLGAKLHVHSPRAA